MERDSESRLVSGPGDWNDRAEAEAEEEAAATLLREPGRTSPALAVCAVRTLCSSAGSLASTRSPPASLATSLTTLRTMPPPPPPLSQLRCVPTSQRGCEPKSGPA